MRRGGHGKPWRPPADGWFVPPKAYLGGLYQHQRSALNGVAIYQNTTQVQLQPDEVGSPATRYTPSPGGSTCETHPTNSLPQIPWIGVGANQLLPAAAVNTFTENGTVSFNSCRRTGGKWVQAVRQWHGCYGFNSHDNGGCTDTYCAPGSTGYPAGGSFESYQSTPDQTKYLNMAATCTLTQGITIELTAVYNYLTGGTYMTATTTTAYAGTKTCEIETAINANSGLTQLTANSTSDDLTVTITTTNNIYGNTGPTTNPDNGMSIWPGLDPSYCINSWIATCGGVSFGGSPVTSGGPTTTPYTGNATTLAAVMGAISGVAGYSGFSVALTTYLVSATEFKILLTMTPPATQVTTGTGPEPVHGTGSYNYTLTYTFGGSATWEIDVILSGTNTAASVYADVVSLLANWNLADDAQYPPRMDGIWQVAPLMSRDEAAVNVSPIQFPPATVNDYRSPVNDVNGNSPFTSVTTPPPFGWTYNPGNTGGASWIPTWTQMTWFDTNAYGFTWPAGYDSSSSAASAWVQYGLTGVVLGAPNPAGYQNYFDFRATVYAACLFDTGFGSTLDWYLQGYGQWLSDAISATGAQLPQNCTQWTNNLDAFSKPPFAYLIQGDQQIYTSPPDTHAHRPDALWAQKCMVYTDLWPSYDFFRPAGADRFAYDESAEHICCVSGLSSPSTGGTFTSQDYTGANISLTVPSGSVWGGFSVGGFYHITASGSTVTLGTLVLALPATWASPSGDTGTVFGMLRWPTAWAILGRDAVSGVSNNGDGTVTLTLSTAENWLLTGDTVDLYSTAISYDSHGNRLSETMTTLASGLTATVIDSTHMKVTATYATIAGTQYIMSHGAPDWCWDDNGRKGDWVYLDWTFDYRTNGEVARLAGVTDCSGNTPPSGSPSANTGYSGFTQTQESIAFKPCCPMALCISPNGESFVNGTTIAFPSTFTFDGRYGARWQAEIEDVMADLLWQAPHTPCGYDGAGWAKDDGTCHADGQHYAYPPLVEARITVPTNGGNSGTETAPAPPTGIGYTSPVTSGSGLGAPGMIGFDPASGLPAAAWTTWGYRANIEGTCGGGCAFNYVDVENLPCVSSYVPPAAAVVPDGNSGTGSTGSGVT